MRAAEQRKQARWSQRAARCRRVLRVTGWIAGLAAIVGLVGMAMGAIGPVIQRGLEIRDVRVEGVHHVTKQEMLDRLALKKGIALHQVSLSYLAERLRAHPWVKEVAIERLPLHELRVTIVERVPSAIVRIRAEHVLIDEEGVVLDRLGRKDDELLPLLTGLELKALLRGDAHQREHIQSSIALAKEMAHSVDGRIEIEMGQAETVVVSTQGVRFQFASDALLDQWERFRKVRAAAKMPAFEGRTREGHEVDLRYDNRVIVRERG